MSYTIFTAISRTRHTMIYNDADDNDDEDGQEEYNYTSLKEKIHP